MKRIKLFPAPHLELRVHVSEKMEKDLKECKATMEECDAEKECVSCSWKGVEFGCVTMCEVISLKMLEEKEWND